jgi:hypothetical protein
VYLLTNFYKKLSEAAICEKGPEIITDNFQIQGVVYRHTYNFLKELFMETYH